MIVPLGGDYVVRMRQGADGAGVEGVSSGGVLVGGAVGGRGWLVGGAGVDVDAVAGADEPVGAGAGGEGEAAVEEGVPDVLLGVPPVGVEEIEGV